MATETGDVPKGILTSSVGLKSYQGYAINDGMRLSSHRASVAHCYGRTRRVSRPGTRMVVCFIHSRPGGVVTTVFLDTLGFAGCQRLPGLRQET